MIGLIRGGGEAGSREGGEQGTGDVCAVLWISGQDAVDMEAAGDEEVHAPTLRMHATGYTCGR